MKLYHTTGRAEAILQNGFSDGPATYSSSAKVHPGVCADRVMTSADFSDLGEEVLVLDIPSRIVAPFEQPDDEIGLPQGMPYYRAFLVPAEIVNRYPVRARHLLTERGRNDDAG